MTRAEVVAAKRELRRLRAERDRMRKQGLTPVHSSYAKLEREIAELERKLVQEGTQGWR